MASSESVANSNALSRWWILAGVIAVVACAIEFVLWLRLPPQPRIRNTTQLTNDRFPKDNLVASSDGTQLYFNELFSDQSTVVRIPAAGGAIAPINTAVADPHLLDLSTQSELLISSGAAETDDAPFWVAPV